MINFIPLIKLLIVAPFILYQFKTIKISLEWNLYWVRASITRGL